MSKSRIDTQYLIDSAEIRAVHARYLQGIDRADEQQVRSCFTNDVRSTYHGQKTTEGIETVMNGLRPFFKSFALGKTRVSTHFMGNLSIERIDGDVAETEIYVIAFHVRPGEPENQVAMRSLRYMDRLRRVEDGWRICVRQHTMDWSCQESANFSVTMAERIRALAG